MPHQASFRFRFPDRFDLCTAQLDAGLHLFFYEILMVGFPVSGKNLIVFLFQTAHLLGGISP